MKKRIAIATVTLVLAFVASGVVFAKTKGQYHFKGDCTHTACHCTEFWAEAGTAKCYYCGHYDYMHKKK